jgi:methionine aminotransferase
MMQFQGNLPTKLPLAGTTIFTVMSAMAREHQALNMAQGFPDFPCSPKLISLVNHYMTQGLNQYAPMPGVPALRQKLSDKVAHMYSASYDPEVEITIVPGATIGLYAAISAVVRENDEVIIIEPAYDSYAPAVEMNGGKPVFVKLNPHDFSVDWNEVKNRINFRTRLIIINSPHNPTGAVLSAADLLKLEKLVENTDIVILSDEVYEHIIFDGLEHQSVARFPKLAARSFIVGSFGKTYHNTGWKMGFVLASENLTQEFRKIYQYMAFAANTPIQHALADYLDEVDDYLKLPQFYQQKRDYFRSLVKGTRFKLYPCQGTYFQLLGYEKISREPDTEIARSWIREHKIASIPVSVFYRDKSDHHLLRFCFAKEDATLEQAAKLLSRISDAV